jgi:extracellular elastinolytic metalloproteinase
MRRLVRFLLAIVLLVLALAPGLSNMRAAQAQEPARNIVDIPDIEHLHGSLPDFDTRATVVQPTATQQNNVARMGATARWNAFGTPHSLIRHGGYLATGLQGEPAAAAREWIRANRALFRLSDQNVSALELWQEYELTDSTARVVLFRQHIGGLPAANDGLITVGIKDGNIAFVSSSAVGNALLAPGGALIPPQLAWLRAAANIGLTLALSDLLNARAEDDWTVFDARGFDYPQRARLRALPVPGAAARPVYETNVLRMHDGHVDAYTMFIDARTGQVLARQSRVQQLQDKRTQEASVALAPVTHNFSGQYAAGRQCGQTPRGEMHPFVVAPGATKIVVAVTAVVPVNDIQVYLYYENETNPRDHGDILFTPEAIVHIPPGGVQPGTWYVEVCPYPGDPAVLTTQYAGIIIVDDSPVVEERDAYNPKWRYFPSNPPLDYSSGDTRVLGCWYRNVYDVGGPVRVEECERQVRSTASRVPWDYNVSTDTATHTTIGNYANSSQAWLSPLTPAEQYRPVGLSQNPASPDYRRYDYPWTNQWYNERCNPAVFASPQRNDIDAAITNLFVQHNFMHAWAYTLNFKEHTHNAQQHNFGNTPPRRQNDPEIGNAQAGALNGGFPTYLGRDNANQITLQDGIPPITNMYLWQPIAGAFYAPCVDGDYDMSVIAHEYGHLIQNRMVGGPDNGLAGHQARAMGESWSDLTAAEYLNGYNLVPLNHPDSFVVGAYVTGNPQTGIRNYNMARSPLNYSNVGYDMSGPQVHADGEIWSAVNYDIRQALIEKYNSQYSAQDIRLQRHCAHGTPAIYCPGNRRWIVIMHDAFLLMPSAVSMLDARDAYLAADMMRFGGENQVELWRVFARRGFGINAQSNGTDDLAPLANFESPLENNRHATIRFRPVDLGTRAPIENARVFVGHYEARSRPIADTDAGTSLSDVARFYEGTYEFVVQAPGYGHFRVSQTFLPGQNRTVEIRMPRNLASRHAGAAITGSNGQNSGNTNRDRNLNNLIDDTESTNWARAGRTPDVGGAEVIVQLAGGRQTVRRVQVSALLRATDATDPEGDTGAQNRFTALRQFEILTCNGDGRAAGYCNNPANFISVLTSAPDAFPAARPRPTAPQLNLRSFEVAARSATHVMLRVLSNQCSGHPGYHGEQDNDPANETDCRTATAHNETVRVAELQVFSTR